MKVVCVEKFEGRNAFGILCPNVEMPIVGRVYTVSKIDTSHPAGYFLSEIGGLYQYQTRKFRPITTEDFRWESIEEVLQNVTSEVHNG